MIQNLVNINDYSNSKPIYIEYPFILEGNIYISSNKEMVYKLSSDKISVKYT